MLIEVEFADSDFKDYVFMCGYMFGRSSRSRLDCPLEKDFVRAILFSDHSSRF